MVRLTQDSCARNQGCSWGLLPFVPTGLLVRAGQGRAAARPGGLHAGWAVRLALASYA